MSALTLRILACLFMFLDHIGYCLGSSHPLYLPLRCIGRLAFPIFVFLIVNGFRHTSNRPRYALRLALFAVISQVPFALFCGQKTYFSNGNVFVTLLICLLVLWATDALRRQKRLKWFAFLPPLAVFALYYFGLLHSDYGAKAILMTMTFYLFDGKYILTAAGVLASVYNGRLISLGLAVLHLLQGRDVTLNPLSRWEWAQLCSLAALLPVFLYNGEKGRSPKSPAAAKAAQLGFYLFYPVHLLLLWALW